MSLVPSPNDPGSRLCVASRLVAVLLAMAWFVRPALAHDELWMDRPEIAAWGSETIDSLSPEGAATNSADFDATSFTTPLTATTWMVDGQVVPAQASQQAAAPAPRRGTTPTAATRSGAPVLGAGAVVGLASVPFMIGDTGAGTCIGLQGIVNAELSHPTLACARLNIAEANTAVPVDRLYYSYRHFHNASTVAAYQFHRTLDYDRHLLAGERTFWDGAASVELRLPIEQHITSSVFTTLVPSAGVVELLDATQPERTTELGNIAAIFKYLLWEDQSVIVSGGLGVTVPTARDVDYFLNVNGTVEYHDVPGLTADVFSVTVARFANETVYLEPFLAWLIHPGGRWYHQGFLQVEAAANPTRVTFFGNGAAIFEQNGVPVGTFVYAADFPGRLDLFSQTLMRINLGLGRILVERPRAAGLRQLVAMGELHYSTTLQDANLTNVPLTNLGSAGSPTFQTITLGNSDNRVDILNASLGVAAQWGPWALASGCVAPIREAPDRGFDFEYNLQLQRLF